MGTCRPRRIHCLGSARRRRCCRLPSVGMCHDFGRNLVALWPLVSRWWHALRLEASWRETLPATVRGGAPYGRTARVLGTKACTRRRAKGWACGAWPRTLGCLLSRRLRKGPPCIGDGCPSSGPSLGRRRKSESSRRIEPALDVMVGMFSNTQEKRSVTWHFLRDSCGAAR